MSASGRHKCEVLTGSGNVYSMEWTGHTADITKRRV